MSAVTDNIRQQIAKRMEQKGLAHRELSKKAGLNYNFIYKIISGKSSNPTIENISLISNILNCKVDDLLQDPDKHILTRSNEYYENNTNLLTEVFNYTVASLQNNIEKISFSEFLDILKDGYIYSLKNNNQQLDKKIIDWTIDKKINSIL